METLQDRKKRLRNEILERRAQLTDTERQTYSEQICQQTIGILEERTLLGGGGPDSGALLTYMPFGHEVDVAPVMEFYLLQGKQVALPKINKEHRTLDLYYLSSPDELVKGVWGIWEPSDQCALVKDYREIAAVIVPGVAFDSAGGRVGYGRGYYDMLIRGMKLQGARPLLLAPAFRQQLVPRVPMDEHDQPVDMIITEEGVVR